LTQRFDTERAELISNDNSFDPVVFGKKKPRVEPELAGEVVVPSKPQVSQGERFLELMPSEKLKIFLSRLADLLILPSDSFPPQERALIDDLAARVATLVTKDSLVTLVERLISHHSTPPAVITALLHQDEEIALPLLTSTVKLSESDLISVMRKKGPVHQDAIAQRERLAASICDAVVSHGGESTLRIMLQNESSQISRPAYVLLSQRSLTDQSLLNLLIERESFPADIAHLVFWWSGPLERKRIIERFSCQRDTIREIMPDEILDALRAQGGASSYAVRMIQRPERMLQENIDSALAALTLGDSDKVLEILSEGAAVKEETVAQILDDLGGEAVAVLAKSCGFGRKKFFNLRSILANLKDEEWDEDKAQNDIATIIHDTLSTDRADVVLRYWDRTSREVTD
jgi:uncharacterized protein (DUF2336 family)